MRSILVRMLGVLALVAMLLPGAFIASADDAVVDIDVSLDGGATFIDPDDFDGRTIPACVGEILIQFTVGVAGDLLFKFQGFGSPPRQEYLGVEGALPGTVTEEILSASQVRFNDVAPGDVFTIRLKNNFGYNTMEAGITGVPGGGTNEFEFDTQNFACDEGGGPGPSPCPAGGVIKDLRAIALASDPATFYLPEHLLGTGNDPEDSRRIVQLPGGNIVIQVQEGELVWYDLIIGGIDPAIHPNLVVKDRFQNSYQQVDRVLATNGDEATKILGPLPALSTITAFSYHVSGGEVTIFNVPHDGTSYHSLILITEITADRGYITNNVQIAGKIVAGKNFLVSIPGVCRDSFETSIFTLDPDAPDPFLDDTPTVVVLPTP